MRLLSSAPTDAAERDRFIRPAEIGGIAAMVVLVLFFLFPQKTLLQKVLDQQSWDALTLSYLENLLRVRPHDDEMRLVFARALLESGQMAKARRALAPLLGSGDQALAWQAQWLEYRILRTETYAQPADSSARRAGLAQMRAMLRRFAASPGAAGDLDFLAREALALNDPRTAAAFYVRLARSKKMDPTLLARAARIVLGIGEYRHSAELYFMAQAASASPDGRRAYFIAGLRSLQAGNLLKEALTAADRHLDGLADDRTTLLFLTRLSLAAGQPQRAQDYVKRLLHLDGSPLPGASEAKPEARA